MPVAVGIVAGTAIRGAAATVMMRSVLERHPDAFLITLANYGVTLDMAASQEHIRRDLTRELRMRGRARDSPIVLVGHSQGGLAVLRYALDHPRQVRHVFSIGAPWQGAVSAGRLDRLVLHRLPALRDMAAGSPFLTQLHEDLPAIADKVSNIYSTHELFIRPYVGAHIDVPGVSNTLIATEAELRRHLQLYADLELDDIILGRVNHLSEMQSPEVRARIWSKVSQIKAVMRPGAIAPLAPPVAAAESRGGDPLAPAVAPGELAPPEPGLIDAALEAPGLTEAELIESALMEPALTDPALIESALMETEPDSEPIDPTRGPMGPPPVAEAG